jgi:hypothetical protein
VAITFDAALGTFTQNNANTSIVLTTNAAAAAGTKIIVATYIQGQAATTATGGGLSWSIDYQLALSGTNRVVICSALAPAGLASSTAITVNYSGVPANNGLICAASFFNAGAFDTASFTTGAGTSAWSHSLTPSQTGALVYGVSCIDTSTTTTNAPTVGTEVHDFWGTGVNRSFATEYAIGAGGAQTLSGTFSGVTGPSFNIISLASYLEAVAPVSPPYMPHRMPLGV